MAWALSSSWSPSAASILADRDTVSEFLIVSDLTITTGQPFSVAVTRTTCTKCQRCWRHLPDVGFFETHPALCGRCVSALA